MKTIYSALVILIFSVLIVRAQATFQWSYLYDNNSVHDIVEKTIVDNQGNIFLAGYKKLDGGNGYTDPFIAKVSTSGALQYTRSFTHPYTNNANSRGCLFRSAATDNQGNVIVAGHIDSAFGGYKAFVIKYNSSGDTLWGRYAGINDTMGYCSWGDIKIDNSGNIYVAGNNFNYNPYMRSFIIAKYTPNGVLQWIKRYVPPVSYFTDPAYKVYLGIDNSGNIIFASTNQKASSSYSQDIQVIKYNSAGSLIWADTYNGIGDGQDVTKGMALDASGNAYVVCNSLNINYNNEITCVKFSTANGSVDWAFRTDGTQNSFGSDDACAIAVNSTNEIYITGTLMNTTTLSDGVIIKLNSSGAEQWRRMESTGVTEEMKDVKTDNSGVYTVCTFTGGFYNVKTRKFNHSGDSLWSMNYHVTNRSETAKFINVGPSNNVYISGDEYIANNTGYVYLVRYTNAITGVTPTSNNQPDKFSLEQNYPNPFNPNTNIKFEIPKDGMVKLTVFDVSGREVEAVVNEQLSAGTYSVDFNASRLSTGVYFYRLETEGFTDTKKMILVK
jgi:hypothetical protein